MRLTTFHCGVSMLSDFDTIGYDVATQKLIVFLFDRSPITFLAVPESVIFQLIISDDKTDFYHQKINGIFKQYLTKCENPTSALEI